MKNRMREFEPSLGPSLPDRAQIRELAAARIDPAITVCLPAHGILREARQDGLVLGKELDRAADALVARGHARRPADRLLAPARALVRDEAFWQRGQLGMCLYLSAEGMRAFALPYPVGAEKWIGDRFAVRPLAPLWSDDADFWLLALSLRHARLFSASRWRIAEVEPALPQGLAFIDEGDHQDSLQFVTRGPSHGYGGTADRAHSGHRHEIAARDTMFFGQGYGHDDHKDDVARYLQLVDAEVSARTAGNDRPLVIAAVDFIADIYRAQSHHPRIAGVAAGSPDQSGARALLDRAWPVVARRLEHERDRLAARIVAGVGTGRALMGLGAIVQAASDGRVMTLMLDPSEPCWGRFDPASREVTLHAAPAAGDEDLADLAAALTLAHGGELVARRVNARQRFGAILRY